MHEGFISSIRSSNRNSWYRIFLTILTALAVIGMLFKICLSWYEGHHLPVIIALCIGVAIWVVIFLCIRDARRWSDDQ